MQLPILQEALLVVVDSIALTEACPHPSLLPSHPTPLPAGTAWLVASGSGASSTVPLTNGLSIRIRVPAQVSLRATTTDANASSAVNVSLRPPPNDPTGSKPTTKFVAQTIAQAVQPDPSTLNGLPALKLPQTFAKLVTTISTRRSTTMPAVLAVYKLDREGETQELWGYFSLDLVLKPRILPSDGKSE